MQPMNTASRRDKARDALDDASRRPPMSVPDAADAAEHDTANPVTRYVVLVVGNENASRQERR